MFCLISKQLDFIIKSFRIKFLFGKLFLLTVWLEKKKARSQETILHSYSTLDPADFLLNGEKKKKEVIPS